MALCSIAALAVLTSASEASEDVSVLMLEVLGVYPLGHQGCNERSRTRGTGSRAQEKQPVRTSSAPAKTQNAKQITEIPAACILNPKPLP